MARKYARDNRGRFAPKGSGATARGGRLSTAGGNKRQAQTMKAAGGPAGTIGKPRGLKSGAIKPKATSKPAADQAGNIRNVPKGDLQRYRFLTGAQARQANTASREASRAMGAFTKRGDAAKHSQNANLAMRRRIRMMQTMNRLTGTGANQQAPKPTSIRYSSDLIKTKAARSAVPQVRRLSADRTAFGTPHYKGGGKFGYGTQVGRRKLASPNRSGTISKLASKPKPVVASSGRRKPLQGGAAFARNPKGFKGLPVVGRTKRQAATAYRMRASGALNRTRTGSLGRGRYRNNPRLQKQQTGMSQLSLIGKPKALVRFRRKP